MSPKPDAMTKTEIKHLAQEILLDGMLSRAGYAMESYFGDGLTEEEKFATEQECKKQIVRAMKLFGYEDIKPEKLILD